MSIVAIGLNPAIDRILECPNFHVGGHQQARQLARLASGKSANVARALAQLGHDCIATGFIGAADLEFFHEQLFSTPGGGRVLCHYVEVAGKTRENITILDPHNHIETHIRDHGFVVSSAEIELLHHRLQRDLKPSDVAILSGSLCRGLPPTFISDLIDHCMRLGAQVVVDTNGDALQAAARKPLWILKPNLEEFRQLVQSDIPNDAAALRDAARPLLDHINMILISRGAHGAVLVSPTHCYTAHATLTTPAIRTVSCGDHLLAGFVMELAAGRDPERALHTALAVATARALSPKLDEFDPNLLRTAMDNITVTPL